VTAAGASLAFSLALLSPPLDSRWLPRLTGLGALAACLELENHHARSAEIKWPNDILLGGQKAGGVLVETRWQGTQLRAVVVGVGINIASQSINPQVLPPGELNFPATCVEAALGQAVDRMDLLHGILKEFFLWQPKLGTPEFLHAWEDHLAFRGCWVELRTDAGLRATSPQAEPALPAMGRLDGLAEDGSLRLVDPSGNPFTVQSAEIHLRPAGNPL
jgi:BirA family biotin operon repressor/biotin-[acetyl-CoA-carboxylase] ligase